MGRDFYCIYVINKKIASTKKHLSSKSLKMKKYSLLLIVILSYIIAMGQQQTLPTEEKPNIEVTGSAEIELVPDEIYINIVLREKNSIV